MSSDEKLQQVNAARRSNKRQGCHVNLQRTASASAQGASRECCAAVQRPLPLSGRNQRL